MKKKVYIVGKDMYYLSFIDNAEFTPTMEDADLVMFTGGADVTPYLYTPYKHDSSFYNEARDVSETAEWEKALKLGKNMIGICRGSQFLTVMAGGTLVQDVDNHSMWGTHDITFMETDEVMKITSTHHQMMNPFNLSPDSFDVIAISTENLSTHYSGGKEEIEMPTEPEIVYYNKTKALAIQGHPEQMDKNTPVVRKINELINSIYNNEE